MLLKGSLNLTTLRNKQIIAVEPAIDEIAGLLSPIVTVYGYTVTIYGF